MKAVRQRDTRPERALRSALHAQGLRFRVDVAPHRDLRRRADIVLSRARIAIYVDGCFWHSCPEHSTTPKNNRRWWEDKLRANVERDRKTDRELADLGWCVVRVWEHEDMLAAATRVAALHARRTNALDQARDLCTD